MVGGVGGGEWGRRGVGEAVGGQCTHLPLELRRVVDAAFQYGSCNKSLFDAGKVQDGKRAWKSEIEGGDERIWGG